MTNISSLGVGSGLELQKLLNTLVANERQRYTGPLDNQKSTATEKISAYGLLKSSASLFNTSMSDLAKADSVNSRKAVSSNPSAFAVAASAMANAAKLSVEVNSIGQRQSLQTSTLVDVTNTLLDDTSTALGSGALTISSQQGDQFVVNIDTNKSSLADIAAAINSASDNFGVEATIVNADNGPVLVLNAADTGTGHQMTITVNDDDGHNTDATGLSQLAFDANDSAPSSLQQHLAAEDAVIVVNGQQISSSSGALFTDVVEGVSITALSMTTSAGVATVSDDTQSIVDNLNDFVKAFNALDKIINDLGNAGVDSDNAGLLVGDSLLRSLSGQLRSAIFTQHKALPAGVQTLSDIGIRFDREGNLSLDETKLDSLLETDFDAVIQLLTADNVSPNPSQQGVFVALQEVMAGFLGGNGEQGMIDTKTSGLTTELGRIEDRREVQEGRLLSYEENLKVRFSALDLMVSNLNSQGEFLLDQLKLLNKSSD